jgi:hypothetical protein
MEPDVPPTGVDRQRLGIGLEAWRTREGSRGESGGTTDKSCGQITRHKALNPASIRSGVPRRGVKQDMVRKQSDSIAKI